MTAGVEAVAAQPFQTFDGAYLEGLITTQYFLDGNKRTAWASAEAFLEIDGEELDDIDDEEGEAFALCIIGTSAAEGHRDTAHPPGRAAAKRIPQRAQAKPACRA